MQSASSALQQSWSELTAPAQATIVLACLSDRIALQGDAAIPCETPNVN
jgi:hypothetical protein